MGYTIRVRVREGGGVARGRRYFLVTHKYDGGTTPITLTLTLILTLNLTLTLTLTNTYICYM